MVCSLFVNLLLLFISVGSLICCFDIGQRRRGSKHAGLLSVLILQITNFGVSSTLGILAQR